MTEKEKLLKNLIEKTGKTADELNSRIREKVDELSGLISEEGAVYIIASEYGVKLDSERPKKEANLKKIDEITEAKEPVSVIGKIIKKYDKVTFVSKNGEGSVQSILIGDETGIIRTVFWYDKTDEIKDAKEGDVIKIVNAYTRENNQIQGRIEVHYGQYSNLELNPKGIEVELKEFEKGNFESTPKSISEINEGDKNIKITGIITDFDIPRFYFGCPDCFKKVMQDDGISKCAVHNEVKSIKIPIVNLKIDDSTGTVDIVGFRDRAENITKLNSKQIIELTEDIDKYRNFSKKMIGAKISFVGNVSISALSGENQILVNHVDSVEYTENEELENSQKSSEKKSNDTPIKKDKKESEKEKKKEEEYDDLEIEEIDIDDDLL